MTENCEKSVKMNHNPNWHYVPNHSYIILIIGCLGSGKTVLLNLTKNQQTDIGD